MTSDNNEKRVFYLTGANGFVGLMILKLMEQDERIEKVYCPIRDKKDKTGESRFQETLAPHFTKCQFVKHHHEEEEEFQLPEDTTHVILNGYTIALFHPLGKKLVENVAPILNILRYCQKRNQELSSLSTATGTNDKRKKIKGITVVSTAYVQPPAPFRPPECYYIPFLLQKQDGHAMSALDFYNRVLQCHCQENMTESQIQQQVWYKSIINKKNNNLYWKHNPYILSKHIMEHIIYTEFADLPIVIVRPTMVSPSRDGTHGPNHSMGAPLSLKLLAAGPKVLISPQNGGLVNLVFCDDCAQDCLDAAVLAEEQQERTRTNRKEEKSSGRASFSSTSSSNTGNTTFEDEEIKQQQQQGPADDTKTTEKEPFHHPIIMSTGFSKARVSDYSRIMSTTTNAAGVHKEKRYLGKNEIKRKLLRTAEYFWVHKKYGKKRATQLKNVYRSYDYFLNNTWLFPERQTMITWKELEENLTRYKDACRLRREGKTKTEAKK